MVSVIDIKSCTYAEARLGCMMMLISQASSSTSALGKTHGLGQTVYCFMSTIGAATATSMITFSLRLEFLGGSLGYVILAALCLAAFRLASMLPDTRPQPVGLDTVTEIDQMSC